MAQEQSKAKESAALEKAQTLAADWRTQAYLVGGVLGLAVGVLAAYLYVRSAEEAGVEEATVATGDAVKVGLSLLGIVRQITEMGGSK